MKFEVDEKLVMMGGVSLRDWFAGQALAAVIQKRNYALNAEREWVSDAYRIADRMLAEREKRNA